MNLGKLFSALALTLLLAGFTVPSRPPDLYQIIRRIESRQGRWIGFRSHLNIHFKRGARHKASCRATLIYQRLEEKMLLRCFDPEGALVFAFRTEDRDFELYVPAGKTLFRGDILDLEGAKNFESHLHPLHLYRALKTFAIPAEGSEVEALGQRTVTLKIYGHSPSSRYLARRLLSTHEGEVLEETYYNFDQETVVTIRRSEYQPIGNQLGRPRREIVFPFHIEMESGDRRDGTVLDFEQVRMGSAFPDEDWTLNVPRDTPVMNLVPDHLA